MSTVLTQWGGGVGFWGVFLLKNDPATSWACRIIWKKLPLEGCGMWTSSHDMQSDWVIPPLRTIGNSSGRIAATLQDLTPNGKGIPREIHVLWTIIIWPVKVKANRLQHTWWLWLFLRSLLLGAGWKQPISHSFHCCLHPVIWFQWSLLLNLFTLRYSYPWIVTWPKFDVWQLEDVYKSLSWIRQPS